MDYNFKNEHIALTVNENKDGILNISGNVSFPLLYKRIVVFGANPIDKMTSYCGSGMAFPNNTIAFEGSPNYYEVKGQSFITKFYKPNSYYTPDTLTRVVPSIFVKMERIGVAEPMIIQFKLEDTLPLNGSFYRPERTGPEFYAKKADIIGVRSQYEIIKMIKDVKTNFGCA